MPSWCLVLSLGFEGSKELQERTGAVDTSSMQSNIKEALLARGLDVDDVDLDGPLAYVEQVTSWHVHL